MSYTLRGSYESPNLQLIRCDKMIRISLSRLETTKIVFIPHSWLSQFTTRAPLKSLVSMLSRLYVCLGGNSIKYLFCLVILTFILKGTQRKKVIFTNVSASKWMRLCFGVLIFLQYQSRSCKGSWSPQKSEANMHPKDSHNNLQAIHFVLF